MSDIDMLERTIYRQDKRIEELESQRDQLREALEAMLADGVWVGGEWVVSDEATAMAEAALKATEEG